MAGVITGLFAAYFAVFSDQVVEAPFLVAAENGHIADAILAGRGFADPFGVPSGPTAWMPPAFPYLLALLKAATGDDVQSLVRLLWCLRLATVFVTCLIVLDAGDKLNRWLPATVILCGGLGFHGRELFEEHSESWFYLAVANGVWLAECYGRRVLMTWSRAIVVGAVAAVAALCHPILGAVGIALRLYGTCLERDTQSVSDTRTDQKTKLLHLSLYLLAAIVIILPWTIRNRYVLGAWMPIKSNAAFEVWQSQCLDNDGLLDNLTLASHPYSAPDGLRLRFLNAGEVSFQDWAWQESWQSIQANPAGWLQRVGHRFVAACLLYQPTHVRGEPQPALLAIKRVVSSLPFLACFFLIVFVRHWNSTTLPLLVNYCVYLTPFILISYVDRYALPLLTVKLLLVLSAVHTILAGDLRSAANANRSASFHRRPAG